MNLKGLLYFIMYFCMFFKDDFLFFVVTVYFLSLGLFKNIASFHNC